MRKIVFLAAMAALCVACSSDNEEQRVSEPTEVTLTFSPYQMDAMTRTATSIASLVTHLDVWITESGNTIAVHQTSSDANFGTITATLDRTKTYTLYAVGHRAAGPATLTDGIIAFPDEKVTHSMIYKTTFSPATSTSLSCEMTRIVGHFRFTTTDQVPNDAYTITIAFGSAFTRWNIADNTGANSTDRTARFDNFSRNNDGTMTFNLYVIPTNLTDTDQMDITVTALKQNGDEIESKTFADVPIKAGYRTTYQGTYFTSEAVTGSFVIEDWNTFDTVNF